MITWVSWIRMIWLSRIKKKSILCIAHVASTFIGLTKNDVLLGRIFQKRHEDCFGF